MLFLANSKSDIVLELELFDSYLHETKKFLDDEYFALKEQIKTHDSLQTMVKMPEKPLPP